MATSKKAKTPELDTEVANRLRDPFETSYLGVVRTNDPLLLERGSGGSRVFDLYRDLMRDGKVYSCFQRRVLAMISRAYQVDPVEDGPAGRRDAKIVHNMLKRIAFDQVCSQEMQALIAGFSVGEIVWTFADGLIMPKRIAQRAQRRFVYVDTDPNSSPELRLLTTVNMLTGEALEDKKFIVHRYNPTDDNPYGTGLGLQLYWPVFFKRKGILAWNKLNDRFGSPTPWGKYPNGASVKEKGTLFDALKAMSNDGVIMTPAGMEIALLESKLTGSISSQEQLCHYMDGWISEVILSQEPTQATGATGAASNEREDVRLDLVQADADLLSDTLNNTLITWFCELNGLAPCQVSRVIKKSEDLKAASETDKNVASMGFKLSLDAVLEKYGPGWELAPAAVPSKIPGADAAANFAEPDAAPDPLQADIDQLASATQPVLNSMVEQLQLLVDRATSSADLQRTLVQAYGDLDTADMVKLMAAALALADLKGMESAQAEQVQKAVTAKSTTS